MKKIICMLCISVFIITGCGTKNSNRKQNTPNNKEKEIQKIEMNEAQKKDLEVAGLLKQVVDNMKNSDNFHMTAVDIEGNRYDLNIQGSNYAGSYTHNAVVNGVTQQTTDYIYKQDSNSSRYVAITGHVLPGDSVSFGIEIKDSAINKLSDLYTNVPVEVVPEYEGMLVTKENEDGTKTIEKDDMTIIISTDNYITSYSDPKQGSFNADSYNQVTLDYTNSGF